jgi:hypothetical protein
VGKNVLNRDVSGELNKQAVLAQANMKRIEDLGIVELLLENVALAQWRHPEIHEGAR